MSTQSQPPVMGRNRIIAQDLDCLPLELIEEVLKEANFEQVIRLSSWAGPQLTRALAISPSWRQHFGTAELRTTWQKYLQLTDKVNVLCFDTRRDPRFWFNKRPWSRGGQSGQDRLPHKDVAFLQNGPSSSIDTAVRLQIRWLEALSAAFEGRLSILNDASFAEVDSRLPHESRRLCSHMQGAKSRYNKAVIEADIETAIRLCERALSARKSSLTGELQRLASLYEAHPGLLKIPYAPQSSRPSVGHVPRQFRDRARRLQKAPLSFWTNGCGRTYFHNEFLPLVPFDWTLRFLVNVLESGQASIEDKTQFVIDGAACYYLRTVEPRGRQDIRTEGTPWSSYLQRQKQVKFLAGADGPQWFRDEGRSSAHTDIEVTWLEAFVEVVAGLVERFPLAAQAAQAEVNQTSGLTERLEKILVL